MDESFAIAAAIERLHRAGRALSEIAVFYRTNAQSRVLEDGLRRRGVAYRIVGGISAFYDRLEVKRPASPTCWLIVNPRDRDAFERVVNVPKRGIGESALEALGALCADVEVTPLEVMERDDLLEREWPSAAQRLGR